MNKSLLSAAFATAVMMGTGLAFAQSTTTTTTTESWTTEQGPMMREYYMSKKYTPYANSTLKPTVGMALPSDVTIYPLPETVKVPSPGTYSYTIINDQPVVVERSSRKIIHMW